MSDPTTFRYTESHEWFSADGDIITMGITQYAANELTDITYVEMKDAGTPLSAGEIAGEVESVKTTSDVYSAFGGEIIEANSAVVEDPSLINSDPTGAGWLVKVKTTDLAPMNGLLDHETYTAKYPID